MTNIPAPDPLLLALAETQARDGLFTGLYSTPGERPAGLLQPVVVAVSCGADSVCLLHALVQMATAWGLALHVAHIDHGLRPQSAYAAEFVGDLAAYFGLPMHQTALDPAVLRIDAAGLEAAARRARYTFLCEIARQTTPTHLLPCVAVAHHANDQAETVLLRLAQGSGTCNGWEHWYSEAEDGTLKPIDVLREQIRSRVGRSDG